MSRRLARIASIFLLLAVLVPSGRSAEPWEHGFVTLCYHDVTVGIHDLAPPDAMPIQAGKLVDQFDWLRENGYTVIGVDDILADRNGTRPLPEKAVLLTFDDGYTSFYRIVYPLLKAYNYKALLALQTTWMETPADQPVQYGPDSQLPRSYFMTWNEVKEMVDSGYVEVASHSHSLHEGHASMPQQGILQPAAASLKYDEKTQTYETAEELYQRVKADVSLSADIIRQHTGRRPRVMVWPYGRYNNVGVRAALDAGYVLTASLGLQADGDTIPRYLMYENAVLHDVMVDVTRGFEAGHSAHTRPSLQKVRTDLRLPVYSLKRVMHVDLDAVYDTDPAQQERNISALFDRVEAMGINTVYLQAYADPDGNGTADSLYFPNRHLPMRADLFNYVSWQLHRRLDVQVYAWMPVLGFEIPGRPLVESVRPGLEGSTYSRLTPFDAENRTTINEIYEDLSRHSIVSGILYHDDALLGDHEDASPAAMAWLEEIGLPPDIGLIRSDSLLMNHFTRMKSTFLTEFTHELTRTIRRWSPPLQTARNLYAQVVLNPESEKWFAQNYHDFLDSYDYTGLMAMPYMEGEEKNPDGWLLKLAKEVLRHPRGRQKTVFELQAMDWKTQQPVPSHILARQMRLLQLNGIGNIGYYPEDPYKNHPDVTTVYQAFSLNSNKYVKKTYKPVERRQPDRKAPAGKTPSSPQLLYMERNSRQFPSENNRHMSIHDIGR